MLLVRARGFQPPPAPSVTSLSPTGGPTLGGTTVTITGTNLSGATAVSFGSTPATSFAVDSATQITALAPAHTAGTVDVTVTTPGGTSSTTGTGNDYTYTKTTPTITTWPTATAIILGQALSASTLRGGAASVPGSFAFTLPGLVPPLGTHPVPVTFTPADIVNYTTVLGRVMVTVQAATVAVTGVTLDQDTVTLTEDDTVQLTATVEPDNATNKVVTWSTSDLNVALVDDHGLVTALAAGDATITVTTDDGSFSDSCQVTVISAPPPPLGQQAKLTVSDAAAWDHLGYSVALDGDTALVGAIGVSGYAGAAYVYVRTDSGWTQQAKLTAADAASDNFGYSVALDGDTALIGASGAGMPGLPSGFK